jgi:hypothetical protein
LSLGLALPVSLPPFLIVLGWYYVWSRSGWLGSETTAAWLFSDAGVIGVLSLAFAPVVVALTALGARGVQASLEEAARVVARPARVLVRILTFAIWPSIALAVVIVFALAFSELGVPMFLRRDVYPAAVSARLGGADFQPTEALAPRCRFCRWPVFSFNRACDFSQTILRRARLVAIGNEALAVGNLASTRVGRVLDDRIAGHGARRLAGRKKRASVVWSVPERSSAQVLQFARRVVGGGGGSSRRSRPCSGTPRATASGLALLDGLLVDARFRHARSRFGNGPDGGVQPTDDRLALRSLAIVVVGFVAGMPSSAFDDGRRGSAQSSPSFEESASTFWRLDVAGSSGSFFRCTGRPRSARPPGGLHFCLRDLETAVLFYPPGGEPLTVPDLHV